MKLPKTLFVGAADYEVRQVKRLDVLGETNTESTSILIRSGQSPSCQRDTVLHEALHAIVFQSGLHKVFGLNHEEEEKLVVTLTPWVLALLRDNPLLVDYLTEAEQAA